MRSFEIYGKWSVQANKHTLTLLQCSHASVGLAQARPNKFVDSISSYLDCPVSNAWRINTSFSCTSNNCIYLQVTEAWEKVHCTNCFGTLLHTAFY